MGSIHDVMEFFEGGLTPFGGIGIAIAVALILGLRLALPAAQRASMRAPILLVGAHILLVGVLGVLPSVQAGDTFAPLADKTVRLLALTLLLLAIARSFYLLLLHAVLKRGRRRRLPGIFRDIIQVAIYAVVAIIVLRAAGVEPGSLLTTSALLTAVIGLSLQDTLGNLFAGLAIQMQQPFQVGDWVQYADDAKVVGEVLEINWRATRMKTIDRVEVVVPNNLLARAAIWNFSQPSQAVRRRVSILAPNEAPPARVHRLMKEAVVEVQGVMQHPLPEVQTVAFTERGVEYRVLYFIDSFAQREGIDSRVRDRLWYALRRAALPIPAPQRRVTMIQQSAAAAEAAHQAKIVDVEKALMRVPLFKPLPDTLLHEVAMHTERRLYAPGELIIQQGDYGEELFVIEKGDLEVLVDAHDGMKHVASLHKTDFFGEMSLMTGVERKATIRSETEVSLLVVSKETLQPVLEASPELAQEISRVLAERELELSSSTRVSMLPTEEIQERSGELLTRIREFFSI
ncbi:MAG: cyclic nucleotide-binding domain-containing protein [Sandaracinaceae bacterium]